MNTYKYIELNIYTAAFIAAWDRYVINQTKWCKTMIHLQSDRNIFEDFYLKHGINFHWQHQNQACAIHSKPGNY
ncbi:MAG: hypothetical protein K8R37_01305 [Bacteroidales bacterium]|nr:hypothetical protein [Bacteroidales bacterium]